MHAHRTATCQKPNCSAPELCLEQLKFTRLHLDKQISSTGCILTHIELILLLWTNLLPVSFVVLPYNLIIYDDLIILSTFTFSSSFFKITVILPSCQTSKSRSDKWLFDRSEWLFKRGRIPGGHQQRHTCHLPL